MSPFDYLLSMRGLPAPVAEYAFASELGRRWRFDYAWPAERLALEVEGGAWSRGRHVRGKGYLADMSKYNTATILGWRLLRVTPQQMANGEAMELVEKVLRPK